MDKKTVDTNSGTYIVTGAYENLFGPDPDGDYSGFVISSVMEEVDGAYVARELDEDELDLIRFRIEEEDKRESIIMKAEYMADAMREGF